jgi:hypothetical protein
MGVGALSSIAGAARLRIPVEIASSPRDSYFPLVQYPPFLHATPDAHLTVTSALGHAVPHPSRGNLGGLARLDGFAVRRVAAPLPRLVGRVGQRGWDRAGLLPNPYADQRQRSRVCHHGLRLPGGSAHGAWKAVADLLRHRRRQGSGGTRDRPEVGTRHHRQGRQVVRNRNLVQPGYRLGAVRGVQPQGRGGGGHRSSAPLTGGVDEGPVWGAPRASEPLGRTNRRWRRR